MKAFHVNWLLISHQFLSILDSAAAARMVSPTRITLDFCCWTRTLLRLYKWWVSSERLIVMSFGKTWLQEMVCNPIIGGVAHHESAWYIPNINQCFSVLLFHQGSCSQSFLASFFWIIVHIIWVLVVYSIHWFLHIYLFSTIVAGNVINVSLVGGGLSSFVSPSSSPVYPRCANISCLLTPWDWYCLL